MKKTLRSSRRQTSRATPRSSGTEDHKVDQRLALVLHGMSDGFVMLDRGWRFLRVNAAAARFLQKSPEDLLGRSLHDVFPGIHRRPIFAQLHIAMNQRVPVQFEDYSEGYGVWYELRCLPSRDDLIMFFRDITERKRIRDWLNALLEADTRQLVQLRHSLAHEFTAPLRAQMGYAELLLRGHMDEMSQEAREYAQRIIKAAEAQAELVRKQVELLQNFMSQRQGPVPRPVTSTPVP
jgi:PAS domain S-box-containing protein